MEKKVCCLVQPEEEGMILKKFLKQRLGLSEKEISRAKFREMGICVNGKRCKVQVPLRAGDWIEVLLETKEQVSAHLVPGEGPLSVLYEDTDVIVLDKPAGLVVHPTGAYYADTLANRLTAYLRENGEDSVIRILGRLDKETSGVVLAVKNRAAGTRLERQREKGELVKTYLAVTEGIPSPLSGFIHTPIAADPRRKGRMCVSPEGKAAVTRYEVLEQKNGKALVRLQLQTGRTHQIRVHMASVGCPLQGDSLYGRGAERMALHALRLRFRQPFTGEEIVVETPEPVFVQGFFTGISY